MTKSRLLTDNVITDFAEDSLEFRALSEALGEIISTSVTPFTLGIYGKWGFGKTSLMRLTREILSENDDVKTVWINAWSYNKTPDLRISIIYAILNEIINKIKIL